MFFNDNPRPHLLQGLHPISLPSTVRKRATKSVSTGFFHCKSAQRSLVLLFPWAVCEDARYPHAALYTFSLGDNALSLQRGVDGLENVRKFRYHTSLQK